MGRRAKKDGQSSGMRERQAGRQGREADEAQLTTGVPWPAWQGQEARYPAGHRWLLCAGPLQGAGVCVCVCVCVRACVLGHRTEESLAARDSSVRGTPIRRGWILEMSASFPLALSRRLRLLRSCWHASLRVAARGTVVGTGCGVVLRRPRRHGLRHHCPHANDGIAAGDNL